jgi:5-methyltetrahydrofolate--homocysteine methyltransferase
MVEVGRRFESGEYFLSELVVSGEVMRDGIEVVKPYIKGEGVTSKGSMVIATVAGDMHDIGKNIVTTLARVQGLDVFDLGVDVPTDKIVEVIAERKPQIMGLSALLTSTMLSMGEVIEALKGKGIRDQVKVIIGGAPVTVEFAQRIGADHRAANALEGVHKCLEWVAAG